LKTYIAGILWFVCSLVVLTGMFVNGAVAADININATGSGDYPTIQAAVSAANDGDTIWMADGIYTGIGNKDVDTEAKAIVIRSVSDNPSLCVIDCQNAGRGFIINSYEDENTVIQGLTIQNGYLSQYSGGCIYVLHSSPTIANCILTGSHAWYGGAISISDNSNPRIENCSITFNTAEYYGGGIRIDTSSSPIIGGSPGTGNYFEGNGPPETHQIHCGGVPATPNNTQYNTFAGYHLSDYYVAPQAAFDLSNCISLLTPVTQDIYVSPSGNDGDDGLSWNTAFQTIQHALSVGYGTDVNPIIIHLAAGEYSPSATGETFPLPIVNRVSISGEGMFDSIINAESSNGVLYGYYEDNLTINDLTITGGSGVFYGSGLELRNSSPMLTRCSVTGNQSSDGGGLYCRYSSATLYKCLITNNIATSEGGGIYMDWSPLTILECVFQDNSGTYGGGLYAWNASACVIRNSLFTGNTANLGAGIVCTSSSTFTMMDCTLTANTASSNGGGIYNQSNGSTVVMDTIIWGNTPNGISVTGSGITSVTYSDVQGGFSGTGNLNADPRFVTGPLGSYYLSQIPAGQMETSVCVDAGSGPAAGICFTSPEGSVCMGDMTTRTDIMTDASTVDMGYHYPPEFAPPTPTVTPAPTATSTATSTPVATFTPDVYSVPSTTPLGFVMIVLGLSFLLGIVPRQ
jgi:Periplasmic copper-binding protein (NosD)